MNVERKIRGLVAAAVIGTGVAEATAPQIAHAAQREPSKKEWVAYSNLSARLPEFAKNPEKEIITSGYAKVEGFTSSVTLSPSGEESQSPVEEDIILTPTPNAPVDGRSSVTVIIDAKDAPALPTSRTKNGAHVTVTGFVEETDVPTIDGGFQKLYSILAEKVEPIPTSKRK